MFCLVLGLLCLHQEAVLQGWVIGKDAREPCCHHANPRLADTAGCHALMLGINDQRDAFRLQNGLDGFCDLCGHGFLGLQAFGKNIDDPC